LLFSVLTKENSKEEQSLGRIAEEKIFDIYRWRRKPLAMVIEDGVAEARDVTDNELFFLSRKMNNGVRD
jgi:hypothetical protein